MSIVIINTGSANLFSVQVAINRLGYKVNVSNKINDIVSAKKIFLPGVGSAFSIMDFLKKKKLIDVIRQLKQPILGICLGMQLLSIYSEENNNHNMLNIIPYPTIKLNSKNLSLPHIGWNVVHCLRDHLLFNNININSRFYFLHSYCIPINLYTVASVQYGSIFSAAIQKDNFFGVQFHPEKSGKDGEQLLKNFLEIKKI